MSRLNGHRQNAGRSEKEGGVQQSKEGVHDDGRFTQTPNQSVPAVGGRKEEFKTEGVEDKEGDNG